MKNRYAMTDTQSELCALAEKYADAYADVRLRMDFEEYIHASQEEKEYLCLRNIEQAAKYISAKDKSFRLEPFCQIIKNALSSKAETCGTVGQLCQQ